MHSNVFRALRGAIRITHMEVSYPRFTLVTGFTFPSQKYDEKFTKYEYHTAPRLNSSFPIASAYETTTKHGIHRASNYGLEVSVAYTISIRVQQVHLLTINEFTVPKPDVLWIHILSKPTSHLNSIRPTRNILMEASTEPAVYEILTEKTRVLTIARFFE